MESASESTSNHASELFFLAGYFHKKGRLSKAEELYRHTLTRYGPLGDVHAQARCTMNLANCVNQRGRLVEAEHLYRHALNLYEPSESVQDAQADCTVNLAICVVDQGRMVEAEKLLHDALTLYEPLEDTQADQALCTMNLAICAADQGRMVEADGLYRYALTLFRQALTLYEPLEGNQAAQARSMADLADCLSQIDPLEDIGEQDELLEKAQTKWADLGLAAEANQLRHTHARILVRRAKATEETDQRQALLEHALELAVPAALDADTRRYQFPSESRRRIWMETVAAPRIGLALQLAAKTGKTKLISDLIAVWRTAGTLNRDSERQATAAPPSSSQTTDTALDIVLTETAISGDPTPWAPPLAAGTTESAHEYNLKRKPTPTLLMPNGHRRATESFTPADPFVRASAATAFYR